MDDILESRVAAVVATDLAIDEPAAEFDLVAAGLLDSLALVTLVVSLEDDLRCTIPLDRVNSETFRSVRTMSGVVREVLGAHLVDR